MLILQGTLRAATTLGGNVSKKTGEVVPERHVLQVETVDNRGLVQMDTITVPSLASFMDKVGKVVNLPVRAWVNTGRLPMPMKKKRLKRPFKGIPGHVLASFPSHVLGVCLFRLFKVNGSTIGAVFPLTAGAGGDETPGAGKGAWKVPNNLIHRTYCSSSILARLSGA